MLLFTQYNTAWPTAMCGHCLAAFLWRNWRETGSSGHRL